MPNTLSAFTPYIWAKEMQGKFFKENVAIALANTELRDELNVGERIYKPYRGSLADQSYTKGNQITTYTDLVAVEDYGEVDTCRVVPFYVDDLDKLANKWDVMPVFAGDAQKVLNNRIDQKVLSEGTNALQFVSAQDLGGSGIGSIAIGQANIPNLFFVAARKLDHKSIPTGNRFACIGSRLLEQLRLMRGGRETSVGDQVLDNGAVGTFGGFNLYFSENIPFTAVVTYSGQPSDDETIIIDGITFTFQSTGNCVAAGDVDIAGAGEDTTYANLVNAINGTGSPGASAYIAVSADDRETLRNGAITATQNAGANTVTITGYGDVAIVSAATNISSIVNTQYPLFGMKGAIDLLVKKAPNVEFYRERDYLGRFCNAWTYYGTKTFNQGRKSLVYAKVDTSNWV